MSLEVCLPSRLALSLALTAILFPSSLRSQTDEVHVIPRDIHPPKSAANATTDPALQNTKPLRTDVSLVLVPVTVRDAMNRPIVDLKTDNFRVFEENQPQDLRLCWREDAPISVGVILDFSKSMSNKIETETAAVREFFNNANSQDDYFVVAVSDRPHVIADSSDSFDELQRRMATTVPDGNTALLDGIFVGLKKMQTARYPRRALLIISDGGDNHSYYNTKKIKRMAEEADVMIYAIGVFDNMPVPVFKTIEEKLGQHLLTEITELTGGFTIAADNREKLPEIAGTISRSLREQYILAYRPKSQAHDGKWKKIKVQVMGLERLFPLHVNYKKGYISPG